MSAFDGGDTTGFENNENVDICENNDSNKKKGKNKSNVKNKNLKSATIETILNDSNYDNQTKMG